MTTVECPLCSEPFDVLEAAHRTRCACPACGAGWVECHRPVQPQPDPDAATVRYPIDGPAGVTVE